jgi:hypothetical protein
MNLEDIRREGVEGRMAAMMTAVVVDGDNGKEYRLPVAEELKSADDAGTMIDEIFKTVPSAFQMNRLQPIASTLCYDLMV